VDFNCNMKTSRLSILVWVIVVVAIDASQAVNGTSNSGCFENNVDFRSNDLPNGAVHGISTAEDCAKECRKRIKCKFFTYRKIGKVCWLKRSDSGRESAGGHISGRKNCLQSSTLPGSSIECADDTKSSARIGGPDSCVVKPHSEPWIARLVMSDAFQLSQTILKMVVEYRLYQKSQNVFAMSKLLKDFDDEIDNWVAYFVVQQREEAKSMLISIRYNLGANNPSLQGMINRLLSTPTVEFASKSVYNVDGHNCGGSLISKRHVLTAAHCVCTSREMNGYFTGNITGCNLWKQLAVVLGDHDVERKDGEKVFRINNTSVYEQLAGNVSGQNLEKLEAISNDFAIIHLEKEVSFDKNIDSIQLPNEGAKCPSGKMPFVASGWGKDRPKHQNIPMELVPTTRYLQAVKQECFDVSKCTSFKDEPDLAWCVGDSRNLQNGPCEGDSGGPLTATENGITTLYGVLSTGAASEMSLICRKTISTYGRISEPRILNWIKSII